jgi:poly-gamma-glutamate capsule biosynthesis protein CapA/YwtB (metallophosphatase superfamily)
VLQPIEQYGNGVIFYSLGNFVFDQVQPGTQDGLAVGMVISPETIQYTLFPVRIEDFRPQLQTGSARETMMAHIAANAAVEEDIRDILATGTFTVPRRATP